MIISSQGEACSPNDDIKALDLHGTNALRDRLLQIQANSDSGEAALLAGAEIELENDKKAELAKIEEARQALQAFRNYLAQSSGVAADALPNEEELEYSYNPDTQQCEITRLDGQDIELDLRRSSLQGELPLPPQLMVTRLLCQGNELTALPELPANLTELNCNSNQLTTLPELPASLTELYCAHNQLVALTELPPSLTLITCGGNQLTFLPELPANLTDLHCGDNQLSALPELPASLTELYCAHNQLTTLPVLPTSLTTLDYAWNNNLGSDPATRAATQALIDRGGSVSTI
jgi:Leucine-rich repeat (LRR) protein